MADISQLTLPNGAVYDIKDEFSRNKIGELKSLAYKDSASGSFTPAGEVSAPELEIAVNSDTIMSVISTGTSPKCTLPAFTATVIDETLTLTWRDGLFIEGTAPMLGDGITVLTGIESVKASAPTFTGKPGAITVE